MMRLVHPRGGQMPGQEALSPSDVSPGIDTIYRLTRTDDKSPEYSTIYFLNDISPLVNDPTFYDKDQARFNKSLESISWVLVSYINGFPTTNTPVPPNPPPLGTEIVINGSTPKAECETDYHSWYDQEHVHKLGAVPGWQLMRRYKLEKVYGEVETASFYGVNFYDEKNGLGGPEWKASATDWTLRIRKQAARPNVRRTWKLVGIGDA